ncbi:hypothetical protein EJ08DRAFT_583958 [Tothia fuscella]|uniref:STEEP1 domain-containing protein n=1 Tax=Tothia fuscella TaxID=1048955 RepID=A0A9P4NX52_9PEZI|nr:hypothetical protein EJ08DRAFT_583958 [Tothia fuscella]
MASASPSSPTQLHTYHCLCSNLLFASTRELATLPRRTSLDKSHILPLPSSTDAQSRQREYAILLTTTLDRKPVVIRSEEGFEKRYLQRCGRCQLVVGYQLDKSQYEGVEDLGRKDDVIYLLPGGLLSTDDMVAGKDMSDSIAFAGVGLGLTAGK